MRGNMRDVEDIARYVLEMFLNTKYFKAMGLTLDRQRVYLGFKNHKLSKNQKVYIQRSSAENSCKHNARKNLHIPILLYRVVQLKLKTSYLIVSILTYFDQLETHLFESMLFNVCSHLV